jgi:hypothetical protein
LREERKRQGLTLRVLSKRTGIDEPALSRLETGKNINPTQETLDRIAYALGKVLSFQLRDRQSPEITGPSLPNGTATAESAGTCAVRECGSYPTIAYPAGSTRLAFLRGPLNVMFSIIDTYIEKFDRPGREDLPGQMERPYFYNERATLSLFAGAVWRSNPANLVLEEFCDEKCSTGDPYKGRSDIWFEAGGQSCFAEAKQDWPSAPAFSHKQANDIVSLLRDEADAAYRNARSRLEDASIHHALGMVFVTPYILRKSKSSAASSISAFERTLGEHLRAFTRNERYDVFRGSHLRRDLLKACWFEHMGSVPRNYPGVEVLICERRPD